MVAGAAVVLAAAIGVAAWYGFEAQEPEQRAAEPVAQPAPVQMAPPVPIPMARPVNEAPGVPLRVDDQLERFGRGVNASAANRGSERVPAR